MTNDETDNAKVTPTDNTTSLPDQKRNEAASSYSQQPKEKDLDAAIKSTWNKLSDGDVKLYATNPDQFFAKVKEKYGLERQNAQELMTKIKVSCGSCTTEKAS